LGDAGPRSGCASARGARRDGEEKLREVGRRDIPISKASDPGAGRGWSLEVDVWCGGGGEGDADGGRRDAGRKEEKPSPRREDPLSFHLFQCCGILWKSTCCVSSDHPFLCQPSCVRV
jgi:hypothetical protein